MSNLSNSTATVRPIEDVQQAIIRDVATAVKGAVRGYYLGVVGVAFNTAIARVVALKYESPQDKVSANAAFGKLMMDLANAGESVFSNDSRVIEAIKGMRGEARRETVRKLVTSADFRKENGIGPMHKALSRIKTAAAKVSEDVYKNHFPIIVELSQLHTAGADKAGLKSRWDRFVAETYGESGTALDAYFTEPTVRQPFNAGEYVQKIMESIFAKLDDGKLSGENLAALVAGLEQKRLMMAEVAASTLGADETMPEGETEQPETLAA